MKPEIVMAVCQHFNSGIGNYSFELARHMLKEGLPLTLYKPFKATASDTAFHSHEWIRPVKYRSFRSLHSYLLPLFIRKALLSAPEADLFHAHWFMSGLALTYAMEKPTVVTMHDVSLLHVSEASSRFKAYYLWALERFMERNVPLIVVSETARQDVLHYTDYSEELVHVVPNGINFERFYPLENSLSSEDTFTIIYSGGLGRRKNVGLLLKAFKELLRHYPHLQLRIAGAFPEQTEYPFIAHSLGISDKVEFTGYIPDEQMNAFYNSGDLMIYTSLYEGFGFAPLEAMAAGVPVLTTQGGALKETAVPGAQQIDYVIGDIMYKASKAIENEVYRQQLIAKGAKWVRKFKWENAARQTLNVYARALQNF